MIWLKVCTRCYKWNVLILATLAFNALNNTTQQKQISAGQHQMFKVGQILPISYKT